MVKPPKWFRLVLVPNVVLKVINFHAMLKFWLCQEGNETYENIVRLKLKASVVICFASVDKTYKGDNNAVSDHFVDVNKT